MKIYTYNVEIRNCLNGVQYLFYAEKNLALELFFHTKEYKLVREKFVLKETTFSDHTFALISHAYSFGKQYKIPVSTKS